MNLTQSAMGIGAWEGPDILRLFTSSSSSHMLTECAASSKLKYHTIIYILDRATILVRAFDAVGVLKNNPHGKTWHLFHATDAEHSP